MEMTSYFIRRFLLIIPTFIGITLLVFAVTRLVPGGPIERLLNEALFAGGDGPAATSPNTIGTTGLTEAQLDQLRAYYGFDKPILISYVDWLRQVLVLDLGTSTRYNEPVWDTIKTRFPISIFYGLTTLILTYAVCIPLGMAKAVRHKSHFDNVSSGIVFFGYAIPSYVVGIALLTLFASQLEWFPLGGFVSDNFDQLGPWEKITDISYHAVLPLLSYMASSFAVMSGRG